MSDLVERLSDLRLACISKHPAGASAEDARSMADELARLRERLEMAHAWRMIDGEMTKVPVEPGSIPDGIECRDETIRLQDELIAKLSNSTIQAQEIERLRAALRLALHALRMEASHRPEIEDIEAALSPLPPPPVKKT